MLRGKTPELAKQEFREPVRARYAIHGLMHEAAPRAEEEPGRLSFPHSARRVQRRMTRCTAILR